MVRHVTEARVNTGDSHSERRPDATPPLVLASGNVSDTTTKGGDDAQNPDASCPPGEGLSDSRPVPDDLDWKTSGGTDAARQPGTF